MEVTYQMTHEAYKQLLKMDGIKDKEHLLAYINKTYGLLGTVVDITFES